MPLNNLQDFFRVLSPDGTKGSIVGQNPTQRASLNSILTEHILNPSGVFYTFEEIDQAIETHLTTTNNSSSADKDEKNSQKILFHGLGPKRIDLEDKTYWDNLSDIYGLVPDLIDETTKEKPKISVFSIRNPYINPSLKGTQQIEFFLNYMPSIVVSQMVPYLDIEFQIRRAASSKGKEYLDTPSMMRFLLGSKLTDNLTPGDKLLSQSEVYSVSEKENSSKVAISGMEMFLMPQTLTNMGSLGEQDSSGVAARLVRVKPFVPFASIEGMDVSIQNAGAGSFAHKKANLRLKVHDKARMGELSEFFRGEVGFKQALVWTTYGWTAPRSKEFDEYADYINKNMLVKECWQVVNSQFSFDQSGQVSVSLEMVSTAARTTQELTVCEVDEDLKNFHRTVQWINELKKKAAGDDNKFSIPVTAEQVLNAASTNGVFKDIKDMNAAIKSLITCFRGTGNISPAEITELEQKITSLTGENSLQKFNEKSAAIVKKKFDSLARSESSKDPFLPVEEKKDYYPGPRGERLIQEIKSYIAANSERNKAIEPSQALDKVKKKGLTTAQLAAIAANTQAADAVPGSNVTGDIKLVADVVSFGKLFTTFVAPSIMKTKNADEVQIYFYGLNDSCGPMSGMSLAEFPINVKELALAYNDAIKRAGVDSLSIQSFLKLVIETQFISRASIAYGMNRFYKIVEEGGVRKSVIDDSDTAKKDGIEKWMSEFGKLKPPVVEMFIETGERGTSSKNVIDNLKKSSYKKSPSALKESSDKNLIMRIHIYDRAANPYETMQKIVNTGNGSLEVGDIDDGKLSAYVKKLKESTSEKSYRDIVSKLRADQRNYKIALGEVIKEDTAISSLSELDPSLLDFDIVKKPSGDTIKIPRDRKSFKNAIMSSVPAINIGTNGSLVLSINAASKTDGLIGTIRLMDAAKGVGPGKATLSDNGLFEANDLPLRVVPLTLTMTSLGVPTAQLYQTYFVDFETGTSLDNIYSCSQLQHSIAPGKFTTNWTFIYTDGYGKFGAPQSINSIIADKMEALLKETAAAQASTSPSSTNSSAKPGQSSGRKTEPSRKGGSSKGNTSPKAK